MDSLPRPLDRRDALIALALTVTVLISGSTRLCVGVCGVFHDDAIYVSTARALAEGSGYRLIDLPGAPPQTKYPPLYPLLLAGIWRLWPAFPDNLLAMQGLSLLFGAATLAIFYSYLVRFNYSSRLAAAIGGLLCAVSPIFLYYCTQTLSEIPFAFLLVIALWRLDLTLQRGFQSSRDIFFLALALVCPFLCRSVGITLLPTSLFLLWRYGRPVKGLLVGMAVFLSPWVLWQLIARGEGKTPGSAYYTDYLGWWASFGPPALARVVSFNAVALLWSGAGALASAVVPEYVALLPMLPLLTLGLGLISWMVLLTGDRRRGALSLSVLGYAALVLVWPWPSARFFLPLYPLFTAFALQGGAWIVDRLPGKRVLAFAGTGIIALGGIISIVDLMNQVSRIRETGYPNVQLREKSAPWPQYQALFAWVRDHTESGDITTSGLDSMVALYTGRPSYRTFMARPVDLFYGGEGPPLGPLENLCYTLEAGHPRYLIDVPMVGFGEEKPFAALLAEFRQRYPESLRPVYVGSDPRFVVYELNLPLKGVGEVADRQDQRGGGSVEPRGVSGQMP